MLAAAGCAASGRIEEGRFRSSKGYRVQLPENGWTVTGENGADLVLRRDGAAAEMIVNASCDETLRSRSHEILARHLLMGLRHRTVVERGEAVVSGRAARHVVLEADADGGGRVRVDAYVVKDDRCVYDFLYAAPAATFEAGRGEFQRLVESFTASE